MSPGPETGKVNLECGAGTRRCRVVAAFTADFRPFRRQRDRPCAHSKSNRDESPIHDKSGDDPATPGACAALHKVAPPMPRLPHLHGKHQHRLGPPKRRVAPVKQAREQCPPFLLAKTHSPARSFACPAGRGLDASAFRFSSSTSLTIQTSWMGSWLVRASC